MRSLNQRGASILEVVIMSGVMVAMLTGFMSLMSHEAKSMAYLEDKLSHVALGTELRMQFSNPDYCRDLLEDILAPRENKIKDIIHALTQEDRIAVLEKIFQKKGSKAVYDQLEIKRITLESSDLTTPNSSGVMNVVFYSERMRKGGGPPNLQPIKIKTRVSVGAGYKIESCSEENEESSKQSCVLDSARHSRTVPEYSKGKGKYKVGELVPEGTVIKWREGGRSGGREGDEHWTSYQDVCINAQWVSFALESGN